MRRIVVAGMIANGLEWYDFALYGYFAPLIGRLFFPGHDIYVQLIATYGVFAAGFIMRPVGAMLFGYLGDRFGRKFSLTLSIFMMAVPTTCIGLLPTYASIGIFAPMLLTFVRLLQGLSLAGQFSGSIAFIVEHAPMERRGLAGSTTVVSLCIGMLCGSLIATIFSTVLNTSDFESWGWRAPFLIGFLIAFAGYYIRHSTEESPHYEKAKNEGTLSETPILHAFQYYMIPLLRGIGMYLAVTVPFYTLTVFLNGFMISNLKMSLTDTYLINTLSVVVMTVLLPFTAHLTDRLGRKLVLMVTAVVYFLTSFLLFWLMNQGGFANVLIANVLFAVVIAFYIGAVPALLVELFPTSIRYTGMAISYNIAAIFGGLTPVIETWLVRETQINTIVAAYIMLCAVISFIAFIGYHDSYKEELA